ncbi:glycine N-phenylacetyltransferase-like [Tenrec ecaudatus]|uniref:glycine N-phenylacetyltransferase-like n=1 Tax=Tenrec ecaudatus TaxID=94439 RepID=UPI003F5A8CDD
MMLTLQGAQMLQMLENSLRKSLPESLKVYGTVFHMNQGNPFKLKALVDKWPDFNTVIIHPEEQEMTDDLDHYTNTYHIYSKDPKSCREFLDSAKVINWKQHLQIQSSQSSLNEVIQSLAVTKGFKVKQTQCFLFVMPETAKKLFPSLVDAKNLSSTSGRPKAM